MDISLENNKIKVMVRDGCSVGHVVRSLSREIVHRIRVVDLIFTLHRKHIKLGILGKAFLVSI